MDDKKFQSLSKPQQDVVLKIASEAERQGVNPKLAIAIAEAETGGKFGHFDKDKVLTSSAGARGVMQIMPDTAQLYNKNLGAEIDPDDEDSNIKGGVFILKDLLTKYKSPRIAVAMYNASPKANAEFVKKYETDPDAAIMSLKPETHKYSLRVSQNFNLDDDKETGLIGSQAEPAKEPSRYETYESEATKLRKEQEARDEEARLNPPPPKPKTLLDSAIESANKIDPETAALYGAGANAILPAFTDPKISTKVDTGKAQEANLTAQDKLELARQNLDVAAPQGVDNLEDAFRQSQANLERMKNEQALLDARLKGIPSAPASAAPTPQEQFEIEKRKITGAGAPYNTVQAIANERVPYNVAIQAIDTTHNEGHGKGSYDIVDVFNKNRERAERVGGSDFVLTGEKGPGELYLPRPIADPKNAEIEQRTEINQNQQAILAQQQEQERLRLQAELERIRQERAQAGQQHNILTEQARDVKPVKKALNKAETDAEIARRKLARAQEQPNAVGRVLERAGVATTGPAKMGALPRAFVGAGAGYLGVMSYQEALERFKAGDTSEAVLRGLEAGSAATALLPPVGKTMTKARGLGALTAAGLYGAKGIRRFTKDLPPEE